MRHFWSLSAEEQFYAGWPLLIMLALLIARRRGLQVRRTVAVAMGLACALSLADSIRLTAGDPVRAFFVTPTRAWEFAAGGLLALAPAPGPGFDRSRSALAWRPVEPRSPVAALRSPHSSRSPFRSRATRSTA